MPNDAPAGVTTSAPEATQEPNVAPAPGVTAQPEAAPVTPPGGEGQPARTYTQAELNAELERVAAKERARGERTASRTEAQRIARIEQEVQQLRQSSPQQATEPEPKRDQFKTDEEYFWALNDHRTKLTIRAEREKERAADAEARQRSEQQKVAQSYGQRVKVAQVKHPDYHDVVGDPDLAINDAMAAAIQLHEQGPEIAYHLGKNPTEARRIAGLHPMLAAAEIGALAVKLTTTPAPDKKPSQAPEPITPVGSRSSGEKKPEDMTDPEFARWRAGHKAKR